MDVELWCTTHLQGFRTSRDRRACISMMRRAGFAGARTSALQYEIANMGIATELNAVFDEGMGLIVVLSSNAGYLRIPLKAWQAYVRNVVRWAPAGSIWQIGNEWNSLLFTGAEPDAMKALEYYNAARDIVLSRYPNACIITPGVTNEFKDGKGKISARTFLSRWRDAGAGASKIGLHYYNDRPQDLKYFTANIAWLKKNWAECEVVVTETGAMKPRVASAWYDRMKASPDGFYGVKRFAWYCMDHHKTAGGDFQLVDDALRPSALYNRMLVDAQVRPG